MRRLLIYCARVGDVVILTPLMRQLAQSGGLEVVGRPWARDLLAGQPGVGAVHVLADPNAGGFAEWWHGRPRQKLGETLAGRNFDEVVVFAGESKRVKAWIGSWRGAAVVRQITFKNDAGVAHRVEAQRLALANVGLDTTGFDPVPRLAVKDTALAAARAHLGRLGRRVLLVQVGSSATIGWFRRKPNLKGLAPQQWAGLLAGILARDEADAVAFVGVPPEAREVAEVLRCLPQAARTRCHDLTRSSPLAELPAWFAAAHAALSVDTGPAHVAAAVGCPLLVVFGPTDPAIFAPTGPGVVEVLAGRAPCRPCHGTPRMDRCRANICLRDLSGQELDDAWQRLRLKAGR